MKDMKENGPVVLYSLLASIIVVIYVIYTVKVGIHIRDVADSEVKQSEKNHLLKVLNYFDVSVVYGIMDLLVKLIMTGTIIYVLCVNNKCGLAYAVTVLIVIIWVTGLIHIIQSFNKATEDSAQDVIRLGQVMSSNVAKTRESFH